jgi:hypothetical protein
MLTGGVLCPVTEAQHLDYQAIASSGKFGGLGPI